MILALGCNRMSQFAGFAVRHSSILLRLPQETAHRCNTPVPGNPLVSLGLSMALAYLQAEGITAAPTPNGEIQLGEVVLKPLPERQAAGHWRTGATDYQVMLRHRSAQNAAPVVSLSQVLQNQVPPEQIRDRMVVIGYTSSIEKDVFQTPYGGSSDSGEPTPGVIIHAQIASHLISAAKGERSLVWYWPVAVEILWMLGWSLVGGAIAWFIPKAHWFLIAEGGAVLALAGLSCLLFERKSAGCDQAHRRNRPGKTRPPGRRNHRKQLFQGFPAAGKGNSGATGPGG